MASPVLAIVCVALALHTASAQDANVVSAVSCLNKWWNTNKNDLLEHPKNKPLAAIMDNLSVEWLSDPFAQMAIDRGMSDVESTPETKEIGKQGFECIVCIRQFKIPPQWCREKKQ